MSWLYSQALVEEFSAATCSDGGPFAQLNVMPTQHKFWRNDKTMEPSDHSRFGLTCVVLTADRGAALLTWFLEASRARTSALQGLAQALMVHGQASGATWRGSFAKWSHDSSTWKTAQPSLFGGSDEFSETWPRWGMTLAGESFLLPTPALPICVNASGLWVPTPIRNDAEKRGNFDPIRSWGLAGFVKLWPTPTASLGTKGGRVTPRKGREGGTLIEAVAARMFPTPTVQGLNGGSHSRASIAKAGYPALHGGLLNPTWVEWLMGWPIGWTELKPLEMDKFHEWQRQHSLCYQVEGTK